MTRILSPIDTAVAARDIYKIRTHSTTGDTVSDLNDQFARKFQFNEDSRFTGRSGLMIISKDTGFGLIGKGINGYKNDTIIITRGTKIAHDLLTDADCGYSIKNSSANKSVHAGFNKTFYSMLPEISAYLKNNNVKNVHCVGHSLGGAIATLIAEWVVTETNANANLYTFGSPRVGLAPFAQNLNSHNKIKHIFRATNSGDPITLVPLWPFVHTPENGFEYRVSTGNTLGLSRHYMDSYVQSIGSATSWEKIKRTSSFIPDSTCEQMLNTPNGQSSSFCSRSLEKITATLLYLLKKAGLITGIGLQSIIGAASTMYDVITWNLSKLAKHSPKMQTQVSNFLSHMMAFIRIPITGAATTTVQAIRAIFNRMIAVLNYLARNTLAQLF